MNNIVRLLPCILGLIACCLPIFWGQVSMSSGLCNSQFGPILGGFMSFAFGSAIFVIIVIRILEQTMNIKVKD